MERLRRRLGSDRIGERDPRGRLVAGTAAGADRPEPCGTDQAAVRPTVGLELPDARVRLAPAGLDRPRGELDRAPVVGLERVVRVDRREEEKRLAEDGQL